MKEKKMTITIHEWISLMISALRYGCSRNNHLEPYWTFELIKKHLPKMYKRDLESSLYALDKFCSETCYLLFNNFNDALDDELGNRQKYISFINWCVDEAKKLGKDITINREYSTYYAVNKAKENALRYRIYEVESFDEYAERCRELTKNPVSLEEANKILFEDELKVKEACFHQNTITNNHDKVIGLMIEIIAPKSHEGKVYKIILDK